MGAGIKIRQKRENLLETIEHEFEKDTEAVVDKTGMEPWMVVTLFAVILLVVIGLLGFCVWRFFAKKRGKKDDSKKGADEQGLVDEIEDIDVNEEDQTKVKVNHSKSKK